MTAGQTQGMDTDRHPLWQPFSETAAHPPLRLRDGERPAPVTASLFLEPGSQPIAQPVLLAPSVPPEPRRPAVGRFSGRAH
ncbi:hypothetical protein K353_00974 [Kitasatospora sp. SolWspMP-SS2h]|uniref:hypothetical protein n=1 Tax=Kitasatospora sp. SolWspMP-SS2h TaxID=1305729 RepID=UPI000DB8FAC6|nr:hypothetical protein [Kitasatospora sp. SolWspMP-SS2h]RAJ45476.1 hypothetical protein K353_00974 [Kitasatospora sp. SolWspMP-SS2h]